MRRSTTMIPITTIIERLKLCTESANPHTEHSSTSKRGGAPATDVQRPTCLMPNAAIIGRLRLFYIQYQNCAGTPVEYIEGRIECRRRSTTITPKATIIERLKLSTESADLSMFKDDRCYQIFVELLGPGSLGSTRILP